jgi:hypothetical protein
MVLVTSSPLQFLHTRICTLQIITCQNNNTGQTQYSFQQTTKVPHTFPYPNSETLTMATNELWNLNTLEILSTIAAANNPSPYQSLATILSNGHAALEATCVSRASELAKFHSRQKELDKKVGEIKASLTREQKALKELAPKQKTLRPPQKAREKN